MKAKKIISSPLMGHTDRPLSFWVNIALVGTWLYLLWPLFSPIFFTPIYVIYLLVLTLPAIVYAYLALVGGARVNIGLLIAAISIFAMGETYVRLKVTPPEQRWAGPIIANGQHPYYMFTGVPYKRGQMPPGVGGANEIDNLVTLNSLGFRIEGPLEKSKPENELRIFVTGGSTVFMGAPLAKTIPGQIESELAHKGVVGVRVYNFGIVSAVSGQELALITHLLVDYQPDIVISYGGGNDISSPYLYDPRPGFPYDFVTTQIGTQAMAEGLDLRSALTSQMFKSRFISLIFAPRTQEVRLPMETLRKQVGYRTPNWEKSIIEKYSANLHRMCRLGHAFNFKFYGVLQPLIFQKSHWSADETNLKFGDAEFAAYMRRQYDRAAAAIPRLQAEDGNDARCRFVDLSQIFSGDTRDLFWDFIHVSNSGNATIGSAIANDLERSLLKSN